MGNRLEKYKKSARAESGHSGARSTGDDIGVSTGFGAITREKYCIVVLAALGETGAY